MEGASWAVQEDLDTVWGGRGARVGLVFGGLVKIVGGVSSGVNLA